MNGSILESDKLDGDWKIVTYLDNFGEQISFLNIPSTFISKDGEEAWLLYTANFSDNWNGVSENSVGGFK